MANSPSSKKRIRQSEKRRGHNRWRKNQVKDALRAFELALTENKLDEAAQQLKALSKRLDQVAAKGTIHKNVAARRKSRLTKRLNKAVAVKA